MKIKKVWFDDEYIFVKTDVGHIVGSPIKWFKFLKNATIEQRLGFKISPESVFWEELNDGLCLSGFFEYKRNVEILEPNETD